MQFDNQKTRNVADVVARILSGQTEPETISEELKGDQHKIDKNKNNKIDAEDFKMLRGEKTVKEESCEDEAKEAVKKHEKKHHGKDGDVEKHEKEMHKESRYISNRDVSYAGVNSMPKHDLDNSTVMHRKANLVPGSSVVHAKRVKNSEIEAHKKDGWYHPNQKTNEEVVDILEYDSKEGRYVHKGTYGYGGKGAEHGETDYKKANDDEKKADKKKPARKGYGARQNFVRSYAKESFSGLLDVYREGGLKSLHEALIVEEPTNDEFTKELEDHKAKAELKKKQPDIAKPSVQAVKVEEDVEQVEERSLTEPEMKKKEEYVKGMKKSVAGFKDRYGDRAKSVMYATATRMAKKD
jgi:hypothetical protein